LFQVATDWEDPDFVAVALVEGAELRVYFSTDGGDEFEDAGQVEDGGVELAWVSDLAVSYEAGGDREIAIGGFNNAGTTMVTLTQPSLPTSYSRPAGRLTTPSWLPLLFLTIPC
jgi:hypothetical protein